MDLQKPGGDLDSGWTNEKHLSFINSMETSFVKTMFENDHRCLRLYIHGGQPPRLNRYLPDSSDSTLDFKRQNRRAKTHLLPESSEQKPSNHSEINETKRKRKGFSRPHNPSTDQVVPEKAREEGETKRRIQVVPEKD